MAIIQKDKIKTPYFYTFSHKDINKFDDLSLGSYQKTDNQKTTLHINQNGLVLNKGSKHEYNCFNEDFFNEKGFESLEKIIKLDIAN